MSTLTPYRLQFAKAKILCDRRQFPAARETAASLYHQTRLEATVFNKQPGKLLLSKQLYDLSVYSLILMRYIDNHQAEEN